MNCQPRVGILPLYLALYDEALPQYRPQVEAFARQAAERLSAAGLEVELADVCRVRDEIERAITNLTARDVDLLATLHLAYSHSLEAVDALVNSNLPLALLDTTPAPEFAEKATMDDMMRNHAIHGVQDLACMLRRRGRDYAVVAGHIDDDAFVAEVVQTARAARAAKSLRSMRVLQIGEPFAGMGDFAVELEVPARGLGLTVQNVGVTELAAAIGQVSDEALTQEAEADAARFDCSQLAEEVLQTSNRVGLGVREMLEKAGAGAFTCNFSVCDRDLGVPTVPFLEASKAMARGVGYAGEGDALTAAFVGALLQGFGDVTFSEMFCPDWAGGSIFMSHMGECNPALAAGNPRLVEKDYAFGNIGNPVVAWFAVRPGPATLVNIAPGPDETFDIIASSVLILDRGMLPAFPDVPHFWIQPRDLSLRDFLRRYSECGGTHHLAIVMGDQIGAIQCMARMLGTGFRQLEG